MRAIENEALRPFAPASTEKGIGSIEGDFSLADLGASGRNALAGDCGFPLAVIREEALSHNIASMAEFCERTQTLLAPHGKTTMAPQIFARQLEAGAIGFTAATGQQLRMLRAFGVGTVLYANQLIDREDVLFAAREIRQDPSFEFIPFVDSPDSVRVLAEAHKKIAPLSPFKVMLEFGYPGGRAGVRGDRAFHEVVEALNRSRDQVRLVGFAGFEGLIALDESNTSSVERRQNVDEYLETLNQFIATAVDGNLVDRSFTISAGGSASYSQVVTAVRSHWQSEVSLILRSGCYVVHDHGVYADSPWHREPTPGDPVLRPALELLATVLSRPERELRIVGFGRRDTGSDHGYPKPLRLYRNGKERAVSIENAEIFRLDDQHAYLKVDADSDVEIGDLIAFGVSHPCTTFDKWRYLPVVDDSFMVREFVRTFF